MDMTVLRDFVDDVAIFNCIVNQAIYLVHSKNHRPKLLRLEVILHVKLKITCHIQKDDTLTKET